MSIHLCIQNSHHQIIFAKFNLEIHYPPPYFREVWNYQDANTDLIRRAIDMFDWDRAFINTNVNEKVFILNKTIMNILSNFIPHETLTDDDKDPPWFTNKIKNLIQEKNNVYKSYQNSKNNNNIRYLRKLKVLQDDLNNAIELSKLNYYSRIAYKLTHIQKNTKVYWTLLKRFFNNKKDTSHSKKISHPSLRFNNSIVSQTPYQKHFGLFFYA